MNESLFFLQAALFILCSLIALRLGKEALIAMIALQAILANLFVLKQIDCFSCTITCSDAYAIGILFLLNLVQEYFGKESAKKASQIALCAMLFFTLASKLHLLFSPSPFDTTHNAFTTLLEPAPRLLFASLTSFFLVQRVDLITFGLLKEKSSLSLTTRTLISLLFSQLLDTILFSFLGLYGSVASLSDIIWISYLVKCAMILLSTPLTLLSKRIYKPHAS